MQNTKNNGEGKVKGLGKEEEKESRVRRSKGTKRGSMKAKDRHVGSGTRTAGEDSQ